MASLFQYVIWGSILFNSDYIGLALGLLPTFRGRLYFRDKTMKLPRRRFLQLVAGAAILPSRECSALALEYPARPVHIMVGLPPGLAPDVAARLIGPTLSERLGQPVVVENRPGAGGLVGAQAVRNATP